MRPKRLQEKRILRHVRALRVQRGHARTTIYAGAGLIFCIFPPSSLKAMPLATQATQIAPGNPQPSNAAMGFEGSSTETGVINKLPLLDRFLAVWILLTMALGLLLGHFVPALPNAWNTTHLAGVSLPIALGLCLMMWPVLSKVRYELLGAIFKHPKFMHCFVTSLVLNWVLGPALMTGLAWATLPDLPDYRTGVIMVGLARCIAMVLIWNQVALGDAELCAILVAVNSVLQILLYSPLALFYLQVVSRGASLPVSFWPVARNVLLFLGVPLAAGIITRYSLIWAAGRQPGGGQEAGRRWLDTRFMPWFGPWALVGLLWTIFVLFSAQAEQILHDIGGVCRVAVPLVLYFTVMFSAGLAISKRQHFPYKACVTQAFTATGNNFELAIAVAVATFGVTSKAALAATIGPLIEVPALLTLAYVALWLRGRWWKGHEGSEMMGMSDGGGNHAMGVACVEGGNRSSCQAARSIA